MSVEGRLQAAVDMLAASPPHRTRGMQKDIVTLHQTALAENETDGEFIENLLSVADQLVKPVRCTACRGWFLPTEFNRDGNYYRCPWCNTYPTALNKKKVNGASFFPSDSCRKVEVVANAVFAEYCQLYYGHGSVSSVYAWDVEDGSINIAVIFAQRHRVGSNGSDDAGARGNDTEPIGNIWTSTHILAAEPNTEVPGTFTYAMSSTFYLDISPMANGGLDEWGEPLPVPDHLRNSNNRCSGFVTHSGRTFKGKTASDVPHVATIGNQIQKIENRVRGMIGDIYFGRMSQAVAAFRGAGKKQKVMVMGGDAPPSQPLPQKLPPLPPGVSLATSAKEVIAQANAVSSSTTGSPTSNAPPPPPPVMIQKSEGRTAPGVQEAEEGAGSAAEVEDDLVLEEDEDVSAEPDYEWEEALDEEGNMYYWNNKTEECVWEDPGVPVKPLKIDQNEQPQNEEDIDDLVVEDEEAVEGEEDLVVEDEEREQTVEELLDSLSLKGDISSYDLARALRKQLRLKTIWDLIALGDAADETLAEVVDVFGDRKKICKWIRKNQPTEEEDLDLTVEE